MLVARLDWGFPAQRKYETEEGTCYSYLFQNRYKKIARDMFVLVAHNPDPATVRLEDNITTGEEDLPQSVAKQLFRITGLFSFNLKSRDSKLPVVHANPITSPRVSVNAVFVNVCNKVDPTKDYRYIINDEDVLGKKSIFFVNQIGPFKQGVERIFRNKLVGILPLGTHIRRLEVVDDEVVDEKVFTVDPTIGLVGAVAIPS